MSDAVRRGKVLGQQHHKANFTNSQVNEILGTEGHKHDFSKKTAAEEVPPAEPIVEKVVAP